MRDHYDAKILRAILEGSAATNAARLRRMSSVRMEVRKLLKRWRP